LKSQKTQLAGGTQLVERVIRIQERGAEVIMLQTKAEAYMRMALYQAEPKLGVKIMSILPNVLREEDVKRDLGLPEFDRIVVKAGKHPPREADISLLRNDVVVGRFSVKFSPTGNIRYCIDSWKSERFDFDLLALVPVRAIKGGGESEDLREILRSGESIYYVVITRVPVMLKQYPTRRLLDLYRRLLDSKKEAEGLKHIWRTNIVEVSRALRDYEIIRRQDEMLELQRETLRRQDEMLELQRETLRRQDEMVRRQDEMLKLQREGLEILRSIKDSLDRLVDTLVKVLGRKGEGEASDED